MGHGDACQARLEDAVARLADPHLVLVPECDGKCGRLAIARDETTPPQGLEESLKAKLVSDEVGLVERQCLGELPDGGLAAGFSQGTNEHDLFAPGSRLDALEKVFHGHEEKPIRAGCRVHARALASSRDF